MCIGKIDEVRIVDIGFVYIGSHAADQRMIIQIDRATCTPFQEIQTLIERGGCPAPVGGAFITTTVIRTVIDEGIEAQEGFSHPFMLYIKILLQEKGCRKISCMTLS